MITTLIGGLVFFMFGMNVISGSLEKMAGGKLEHMLKKMTGNPFISLLLGAGITIAMQSSSATTVMLVGLVNSGIMKFSQTVAVIFGANIGTTLTVWILSLSSVDSGESVLIELMKPEHFAPILALFGIAMIMISKSNRKKSIGTILVGFAVLMSGMDMMKDALGPVANLPKFQELLMTFNNPIFGVLIGMLVTAVIQSSAASIGILLALADQTTAMTVGMAIPIVMGQNIGTCITSVISSIGTNVQAKRVAMVHVAMNVIGTVLWLSTFLIVQNAFAPAWLANTVREVDISIVHTAFNVLTALLLMPFINSLVKLAEWLVRDKNDTPVETDQMILDERLLRSPSIAVTECNNLTNRMSELASQNLFEAMSLFHNYDEGLMEKVVNDEEQIDRYEDRLGTYLVHLSTMAISDQDSRVISKMLHAIGDFERLGDHGVSLAKAAEEMHKKDSKFTPDASAELRVLTSAINEIVTITMLSYRNADVELAEKVEPLEQVIDKLSADIKKNHIARLKRGECTIEMGFILSDILNNYRRISDHCSNIAVAVIEVSKGSFDTHEYLNGVKVGNSDFAQNYEAYLRKYAL